MNLGISYHMELNFPGCGNTIEQPISEFDLVTLFENKSSSNPCHEIEFDLHLNEPAGTTHFHNNGFEQRLI